MQRFKTFYIFVIFLRFWRSFYLFVERFFRIAHGLNYHLGEASDGADDTPQTSRLSWRRKTRPVST